VTGLDRRVFAAALGFALGALWRSSQVAAELDEQEQLDLLLTQALEDESEDDDS